MMIEFVTGYLMAIGIGIIGILASVLAVAILVLVPFLVYDRNRWLAMAYVLLVDLPLLGLVTLGKM